MRNRRSDKLFRQAIAPHSQAFNLALVLARERHPEELRKWWEENRPKDNRQLNNKQLADWKALRARQTAEIAGIYNEFEKRILEELDRIHGTRKR